MKIYHYTKGFCLNSIFEDGFIATESKRGISRIKKNTDYVWLTEKKQYPKTALPYLSNMPETNLRLHMGNAKPYIDLSKLGLVIGGVWRFSFDSADSRFKKWRTCDERKLMQNNVEWRSMESMANKVGDEVAAFWIAVADVALEQFTLEEFIGGAWVNRLVDCSISCLNEQDRAIINSIRYRSLTYCNQLGFTTQQFKIAA